MADSFNLAGLAFSANESVATNGGRQLEIQVRNTTTSNFKNLMLLWGKTIQVRIEDGDGHDLINLEFERDKDLAEFTQDAYYVTLPSSGTNGMRLALIRVAHSDSFQPEVTRTIADGPNPSVVPVEQLSVQGVTLSPDDDKLSEFYLTVGDFNTLKNAIPQNGSISMNLDLKAAGVAGLPQDTARVVLSMSTNNFADVDAIDDAIEDRLDEYKFRADALARGTASRAREAAAEIEATVSVSLWNSAVQGAAASTLMTVGGLVAQSHPATALATIMAGLLCSQEGTCSIRARPIPSNLETGLTTGRRRPCLASPATS